MIYGPSALFALGMGALIPTLPVLATGLGAGIGLAGIVASMLVIGQLLGNIPASWVVARAGERLAMIYGAGVGLLGGVGLLVAQHVLVLSAAALVVGMAAAVFALGRHSFMTTRVPIQFRARSLSLLGGAFRAGILAGPFAATLVMSLTGSVQSSVWLLIGSLLLVLLLVGFGPDPERAAPIPAITAGTPVFTGGMVDALRENISALSRVGVAAAALSGVRAARDVLLPLWGISLGFSAESIALVVGISAAVDFALFYVSGQVMDRYGRGRAAVPAMITLAVGFVLLAVTPSLPGAWGWYIAGAAILGVGNGTSSGILLTLGADLSPRGYPAPFLAVWRTLTDAGGATVPLAVSLVSAVSLPLACAGVGVIALLGAAGFIRWIPRYVGRGTSRPGR